MHTTKYFKLETRIIPHHFDDYFFQFIRKQSKLQFLSINALFCKTMQESLFLDFLDKTVDAILVRRTLEHINLMVNIKIVSKVRFNVMFYNILFKMSNLPLTLNGIPIKNILHDLMEMDDIVFDEEDNVIELANKFSRKF